jgi:hypothetical protein
MGAVVFADEIPRFPCYSLLSQLIRQTQGDRVTGGYGGTGLVEEGPKNRQFPVISLFSGNSAELPAPMTPSTAK